MEFARLISSIFFYLCWELQQAKASDYCGKYENKDYYCEEGYCCGNKNCCMANYHYYEMWWFWLLWALIGALTCCCIYHRHQLQRGSGHHFYFARFFNPGVTKDTSVKHHKLPSYNEVLKMPKLDPPLDTSNAPPPYFDNQESIESASTASAAENCDLEVSNTGHEQIYLPVVSCRLTLLDENPTSKMDHKV